MSANHDDLTCRVTQHPFLSVMYDALALILRNLTHLCPSPAINSAFLTHLIDPTTTRQLQIKSCHAAFLASDLGASTVEGTGWPDALFDDPDSPGDPMLRGTVFGPQREGDRKKACLVMVVGITEIATSAFNLRQTLHDRQEARSGVAKIRRLVGEEEPPEDENDDGGGGPKYPRGMLKLELSDGFRTVQAIEYRRIGGLKLGETKLGCKLLLQNVKVLRGLLMLTPESCAVKGGQVEALCADGREEQVFERDLKERLGKEDEPDPVPRRIAPNGRNLPNGEEEDDYIPEGFDLIDAHAPPPPPNPARRAQPRPPPPPPPAPRPHTPASRSAQPKKESKPTPDLEDDDALWADMMDVDEDAEIEAALLREQDEAESRASKRAKVEPRPPPPPPPPPAAARATQARPTASRQRSREEGGSGTIVLGSSSDIEAEEKPRLVKTESQQGGSSGGVRSSSTSAKAEIIDISDSD